MLQNPEAAHELQSLLQTNKARLYLLFGVSTTPNILYSVSQVRLTVGIAEVADKRDQQRCI